jgi:ubiquinol-cytochrome c reductase iron-sulfur subunit
MFGRYFVSTFRRVTTSPRINNLKTYQLRSYQSTTWKLEGGPGGRQYSRGDTVASGFPTKNFEYYKNPEPDETSRKAYVYFMMGSAGSVCASATKNVVVDLLSTMAPAADVLAMANIEVDLSKVEEGTTLIVKWRGKPLFIRHRTQAEIDAAMAVEMGELRDPQTDEVRIKKPNWLILLGVCTHLGCIPIANAGDYKGFFCPCHGSHYDTSGRIRKGPAPLNLAVPPYTFLDDSRILVGQEN